MSTGPTQLMPALPAFRHASHHHHHPDATAPATVPATASRQQHRPSASTHPSPFYHHQQHRPVPSYQQDSALRRNTSEGKPSADSPARKHYDQQQQSSIWTLVDSTRVPSEAVLPPLRGFQLLVDAANVATAKDNTSNVTSTSSTVPVREVASFRKSASLEIEESLQQEQTGRGRSRRRAAPVPGSLSERASPPLFLNGATTEEGGRQSRKRKQGHDDDDDSEGQDAYEDGARGEEDDDDEDDDDDDEFIPPQPLPPQSTICRTLAPHSLIEDAPKTSTTAAARNKKGTAAMTTTTTEPSTSSKQSKKKCPCRPRSRKTSHSVIERRRRQKINERLIHLQCSVPACKEEAEMLLRSRKGRGGIPSSTTTATRGKGRGKASGAGTAGSVASREKEIEAQQEAMIRSKLESALVVEKLCVISHTVDYVAELEARLASYREAFARAGLSEPSFVLPASDSHTCSAAHITAHTHDLEDEVEDGDEEGDDQEVDDDEEQDDGSEDGAGKCEHGNPLAAGGRRVSQAGTTKRKRQGSNASMSASASETPSPTLAASAGPSMSSTSTNASTGTGTGTGNGQVPRKRRRHWGRGEGPLVDDLPQ
ncbi:unnamed protein product [Tilletia controversa]|uniref:BHLH domain-containing protein n=1 Tax=Tilletia controversa TaxID=13291 RepID=A0A8X7SYF8_9BASI|nr:hypothetical protein CF328_g2254 [Tilletia controversa]KAE8251234.1 hypothetical protein A4X06_0g2765 [Tilletia controversa]CAD6905452.1 unnamed protein product [Tilletia controversa]